MVFNKIISLVTIMTIVLSITSLFADIIVWSNDNVNLVFDMNLHLRFSRIVLFTLVTMLIYFSINSSYQNLLLTFGFLLAVIADYFLIYKNNFQFGILFFTIMQLLLIIRHFSFKSILVISFSKNIKPIIVGLFVFFCIVSFLFAHIPKHKLLLPIIIYAVLLIMSCIAAWYSTYNKIFTSTQSQYIFIAMVLFFLCDLTVLMPIVFPENHIARFARAGTGIFYSLCLLLLTSSAHKNV